LDAGKIQSLFYSQHPEEEFTAAETAEELSKFEQKSR